MNSEIYVISLLMDVVKESGKKETIKLIGISPYTDDEFEQLAKEGKTLPDILADGVCIRLGRVLPMSQALTGDEYADVVEMIRDELIKERPDPE